MPIFPRLPGRTRRTSAANAAMTVSTEAPSRGVRSYLVAVYIAYSAVVTLQATVTLNSGIAADYDTRLSTLPFVGDRWGWWVPDNPIPLGRNDTIDVLAPAGGAGVTSAVQILTDEDVPARDEGGGWDYEQVSRE